jgi:hypothetical protein
VINLAAAAPCVPCPAGTHFTPPFFLDDPIASGAYIDFKHSRYFGIIQAIFMKGADQFCPERNALRICGPVE